MKILRMLGCVAVLSGAMLGTASANVISGSLWRVPEAVTFNAVPANVPNTAADVTFDVNSPLDFNATNATIGQWLSSGGAFNITENTAGALASQMDDFNIGSIVEFTGFVSVTTGQQFTATHDDGLTLIIGGLDLGFDPGPTPPEQTTVTYSGPSGNLPFVLVYAECCAGPAVLQVDLPFANEPPPNGVPEPGSLALLGLGLAGMAVVRRRRA